MVNRSSSFDPRWIDTHVSAPFKATKDPAIVHDRNNQEIRFFRQVPDILAFLRTRRPDLQMALASRTHAPDYAKTVLNLMKIPIDSNLTPVISLFDNIEIYPGSKMRHFRSLHEKTGIDYGDMLFFDDELRNREVESLGVTFVHVDDNRGLDKEFFVKGIKEWQRRHANKSEL